MNEHVKYLPFRYRDVAEATIITNEVGQFHFYEKDIVERFFQNSLSNAEKESLTDQSILIGSEEEWKYLSLLKQIKDRNKHKSEKLSYLIVIPTLRCDLTCSYCQVSRADINAKGYDWDENTLSLFEKFLEENGSDGMKIEFQGGEPSLRSDLIQKVIAMADRYFSGVEFVICTNLTTISSEFKAVLDLPNVVVSTSIDGPTATMTENRTASDVISDKVFNNVNRIIKEYGHEKLSALPTITEDQINSPEKVINYYRDLGFNSIFLRPVNYQGFARKSHKELSRQVDAWNKFYVKAMDHILKISKEIYFEEFYTSSIVRKIFADKVSGFVDYASPARYAENYCVIDFDGKIYPTDESRMLSRTRQVDLCIGSLEHGLDQATISELNHNAVHHIHEDCIHCAYMPYCGIDIVDDLSRYARFDVPKHSTWFCQRHMFLFDFIFEKVAEWDTDWLKLFNSWIFRSRENSEAFEIFR